MSRARFLEEAEAEFLREVEHYAKVQPNGAALFRDAVEAAQCALSASQRREFRTLRKRVVCLSEAIPSSWFIARNLAA